MRLRLPRPVMLPLLPPERFRSRWNVHQRGLWGEYVVAHVCWWRGWRIQAHRWSPGGTRGDIDMVVARRDLLAILEVKLRAPHDDNPWGEVFDGDRTRHLAQLASAYLHATGQQAVALRFDAWLVQPASRSRIGFRVDVEEGYLAPESVAGWRGPASEPPFPRSPEARH